jgi:hypothetical protein
VLLVLGLVAAEKLPVRLVSTIGEALEEALVWGKLQSVALAAHVLEKLYLVGRVACGEAFDRRVSYIQTEAKEVNSSFKRFVTKSLGASMRCPPWRHHQTCPHREDNEKAIELIL